MAGRDSDGRRTIDRREVLATAMAGAAAIATGACLRAGFGGRMASAQAGIDATPPAPPSFADGRVSYGPTVASKAAELGYDLDRLVRFVSEEIRYEPYAGALRGAEATLRGLAGNSVDQALLLSALLTEAQITWRFASGTLDEPAANALLDRANAGIARVDEDWGKAVAASLVPTGSPGSATPVAGDRPASGPDEALVADIAARATFAATDGEQRFTSLAGQIAKALDDARIAIAPASATVLPELEWTRHFWVQVADGPRWTSVAPTLPTAATLPDPAETFETVPDDLIHMVSIRLSVETLAGTSLDATDVATAQMTAVQASRAPIEIGVAPPQAMAAAGIAINEALAGSSALVPYLAASDAILQAAASPIPFTIGGGALDVLGAATATPECCQDGELVALSYAVDLTSPGAEPVTIQRYLLDRLAPAARATLAEGLDPAAIAPLNLVTLSDGTTIPADLTAATFLTVITGDIPATYGLFAPSADPAMKGIGLVGASQAGLAASSIRQRLLAASTFAIVAAPHLAAFSVGSVDGDEQADLLMRGDLLRQQRMALAGTGGIPVDGLHPLIVAGIANQVAEDTVLDPVFLYGDAQAPVVAGQSVGKVFAAAEAQGIGILALSNTTAGSVPSGIADAVGVSIQEAIDGGKVVVIPERAPDMAGDAAIGWWEIDPVTGDTRDVYANGKGYVETQVPGTSVRGQDAAEEAQILKTVNTWRPWYQRLGRCVGAAAMIGGMSVVAEGAVGVALGGNPANAAVNVALANGNIVNDVKNLLKGC